MEPNWAHFKQKSQFGHLKQTDGTMNGPYIYPQLDIIFFDPTDQLWVLPYHQDPYAATWPSIDNLEISQVWLTQCVVLEIIYWI